MKYIILHWTYDFILKISRKLECWFWQNKMTVIIHLISTTCSLEIFEKISIFYLKLVSLKENDPSLIEKYIKTNI